MNKEEVLKDNIRRSILISQIYRYSLQSIAQSEVVKDLAKRAKENGARGFKDIRLYAADNMRAIDGFLLKLKGSGLQPSTFRGITEYISSEAIYEISLILDILGTIDDVQELEVIREYINNHQNNK